MRTSRAIVVTFGLMTVSACAARSPSAVPQSLAECEQSAKLAAVPQMPQDFDSLVIRADADLSAYFALEGLCIRVDQRTAYVRRIDEPMPIHSRFELPVALRKGAPHRVDLLALYQGTGSFTDYRFAIRSKHELDADEVAAGTLVIHIMEMGGPKTPLEQRPTVEWTAPSQPRASAPAMRDAGEPFPPPDGAGMDAGASPPANHDSGDGL